MARGRMGMKGWIDRVKRHPIATVAVAAGALLVALGNGADALRSLWDLVPERDVMADSIAIAKPLEVPPPIKIGSDMIEEAPTGKATPERMLGFRGRVDSIPGSHRGSPGAAAPSGKPVSPPEAPSFAPTGPPLTKRQQQSTDSAGLAALRRMGLDRCRGRRGAGHTYVAMLWSRLRFREPSHNTRGLLLSLAPARQIQGRNQFSF